ncbi:TraB/GumN family protein [uncultured Thiohalocapsa sp.]|uniref:TraB/GumN family protein n=1 Tax=uncultured Thiohalocapsa sp. TaxID=768990 RepID=UPI0025CF8777|nr:TraB/GumN family protein [uncultured Thiohalocapsa sp.]
MRDTRSTLIPTRRTVVAASVHRPVRLLALALLLAVAVVGTAKARDEPVAHTKGLLFELTPPAAETPSWLFATMHTEDPRVLRLAEPVADALAAADALVLEVVPDAASVRAAARAMRLPGDTALADLLPPALYRRCVQALTTRGLPDALTRKLKPWAVMTILSTPPARTGVFLDRRLYQRAQADAKPILGLETTAEQLAVFEQLHADEQIALLRAAIAAQGERERVFEALIDAYLRGALDELLALSEDRVPGLEPRLQRRLREMLIDSRNRRLLARIRALPAQRGYFIAVGALHLPGAQGLLAGLHAADYQVRRLH